MMRRIQRNDLGIELRVGVNMNILLFCGVLRCITGNGTEHETSNGLSGGVFLWIAWPNGGKRSGINLEWKDLFPEHGDFGCTYKKPLLAATMTGCYD